MSCPHIRNKQSWSLICYHLKIFYGQVAIAWFVWSTCTPDLNSIEHIWDRLNRHVQAHTSAVNSLNMLRIVMRKSIDTISTCIILEISILKLAFSIVLSDFFFKLVKYSLKQALDGQYYLPKMWLSWMLLTL